MTKPLSMAIACILLAYAAAPAHAQSQPASPLPFYETE